MADINDPENTIIITLKDGDVTVALLPDVAPQHVERMKMLARAGSYDNVCFHRVIDGFMAQTGDVENGNMENGFNLRRAGTGGSDQPDVPAEFSGIPHDRGTIGAARSSNPNSAKSSSSTKTSIAVCKSLSLPSQAVTLSASFDLSVG